MSRLKADVSRMVYVDGGCRRNGASNAIGAAVAIIKNRYGRYWASLEELPHRPRATNQRAELTAINLGLTTALEKYETLASSPALKVTIHSDSRYAVQCMNQWRHKWAFNGWRNSKGAEVVNRDLLQRAVELHEQLDRLGSVTYTWIPRRNNAEADDAVNEAMDAMDQS